MKFHNHHRSFGIKVAFNNKESDCKINKMVTLHRAGRKMSDVDCLIRPVLSVMQNETNDEEEYIKKFDNIQKFLIRVDSNKLISCSSDGKTKLWNLDTMNVLKNIK